MPATVECIDVSRDRARLVLEARRAGVSRLGIRPSSKTFVLSFPDRELLRLPLISFVSYRDYTARLVMVPISFCPECGHLGRFLAEASKIAHVNYYRCDECWHVWALDREHPTSGPRDITPTVREDG